MGERRPPLSRRDVLLGRFSKASEENRPSAEDIIVERVGEATCLGLMAYLAFRGSFDQLVSFKVKTESEMQDSSDFRRNFESLSRFVNLVDPVARQVSRLRSFWENAYKKTVAVSRTSINSKGEIETDIDYETRWEEPYQITSRSFNHYNLEAWERDLGNLAYKLSETRRQMPQAFDLSETKKDSIYFAEKAADVPSQAIITGAAYGGVGLAFSLHEEIISRVSEGQNRFFNDNKFIKRRTLFKVIAAGGLALGIRHLQRAFTQENRDLLGDIEAKTEGILARMDIGAEDNFRRYFGWGARNIRGMLVEVYDKTGLALASGYNGEFFDTVWRGIGPNLENTNRQTRKAIEEFDDYFSYAETSGSYVIPEDLNRLTQYLWATGEITNYADSKSTQVQTRHVLDAAVLAIGLVSSSAVAERLVFPLSEKFLQNYRASRKPKE